MIDLPPRTSQEIRDLKLARIQAQLDALRADVDALKAAHRPARDAGFTCREKDVAAALLAGLTTRRAIADELVISERTVAIYLYRMFGKTGTRKTVDLVVWLMGQEGQEK